MPLLTCKTVPVADSVRHLPDVSVVRDVERGTPLRGTGNGLKVPCVVSECWEALALHVFAAQAQSPGGSSYESHTSQSNATSNEMAECVSAPTLIRSTPV